MALTVEDGTGVANADSYVTLVEWQTYGAAFLNVDLTAHGHDASHEANLRRAAQYLGAAYLWKGDKVESGQALAWPRYISGYVDGYPVASDEIPEGVKRAQMEMAYLIHEGADPFATITGGAVKSKREKVDVIEEATEYASFRDRDAYPMVDQLVGPYVDGKVGTVARSMILARR